MIQCGHISDEDYRDPDKIYDYDIRRKHEIDIKEMRIAYESLTFRDSSAYRSLGQQMEYLFDLPKQIYELLPTGVAHTTTNFWVSPGTKLGVIAFYPEVAIW